MALQPARIIFGHIFMRTNSVYQTINLNGRSTHKNLLNINYFRIFNIKDVSDKLFSAFVSEYM